MIDAATVREIVTQYEKHGWRLRRALLSRESVNYLPGFDDTVDVIESDIEALWFSRLSKPESEAWELRRLGGSAFALVAVIPTTATDEDVDASLAQIEFDMRERTIA